MVQFFKRQRQRDQKSNSPKVWGIKRPKMVEPVGMGTVGIAVLESIVGRVRKAMKAMRVLKQRRTHYFWYLNELQSLFKHLDGGTRGHAYETLVEFEGLLEKLSDGKNWHDKVSAFLLSRRLLKKLEEKSNILEKIVSTTMAKLVTKMAFHQKTKLKSDSDDTELEDRSPYEADLKKDYDYVKEVVTKEDIDQMLTKEAKNALKGAKRIFKEYSKEALDQAIARYDDNKESRDDCFKKTWADVMSLSKREIVPMRNPALSGNHHMSQNGKPKRVSRIRDSLKKVGRRSKPKEKKRVLVLDLSLDYTRTEKGGFAFKFDENTGETVLQACYVFLPGSAAKVMETRVKDDGHFVVKLDEEEIWRGSLTSASNNSKSFEVEGHRFIREYFDNGNAWSTSVDGIPLMELPRLTHQQWVEARKINRLNMATNDVKGILKDMEGLSSDDDTDY